MGAEGTGLEFGGAGDVDRSVVARALLGRFAAVKGIADFCIVDGGEVGHDGVARRGQAVFCLHIKDVLGVVVALLVVHLDEARQTLAEISVVALRLFRPLDFAKGSHARQLHIFHLPIGGHIFRPEVGLHANDMLGLLGRERFRQRVVGIHQC